MQESDRANLRGVHQKNKEQHPAWGAHASGVLASSPFMKLSYFSSDMVGPDAMHVLGSEGKRVACQLLGVNYTKERGEKIADYEKRENGRWTGKKEGLQSLYMTKKEIELTGLWLTGIIKDGFMSSDIVHTDFLSVFKTSGALDIVSKGAKVKTSAYREFLGPVMQTCIMGRLGEREQRCLSDYAFAVSNIWRRQIPASNLQAYTTDLHKVSVKFCLLIALFSVFVLLLYV